MIKSVLEKRKGTNPKLPALAYLHRCVDRDDELYATLQNKPFNSWSVYTDPFSIYKILFSLKFHDGGKSLRSFHGDLCKSFSSCSPFGKECLYEINPAGSDHI